MKTKWGKRITEESQRDKEILYSPIEWFHMVKVSIFCQLIILLIHCQSKYKKVHATFYMYPNVVLIKVLSGRLGLLIYIKIYLHELKWVRNDQMIK
jgi:hypothetical protein